MNLTQFAERNIYTYIQNHICVIWFKMSNMCLSYASHFNINKHSSSTSTHPNMKPSPETADRPRGPDHILGMVYVQTQIILSWLYIYIYMWLQLCLLMYIIYNICICCVCKYIDPMIFLSHSTWLHCWCRLIRTLSVGLPEDPRRSQESRWIHGMIPSLVLVNKTILWMEEIWRNPAPRMVQTYKNL
jgi:hypothetical protein